LTMPPSERRRRGAVPECGNRRCAAHPQPSARAGIDPDLRLHPRPPHRSADRDFCGDAGRPTDGLEVVPCREACS
jgi:hypothetical protein